MTDILRVHANFRFFCSPQGCIYVDGVSWWGKSRDELVFEKAGEKGWWTFLPGPDRHVCEEPGPGPAEAWQMTSLLGDSLLLQEQLCPILHRGKTIKVFFDIYGMK